MRDFGLDLIILLAEDDSFFAACNDPDKALDLINAWSRQGLALTPHRVVWSQVEGIECLRLACESEGDS